MTKDDFETIVRLYKDKVFNTCLGFVKHFDDAEDLAQEVFIEIYQKHSGFKSKANIGTWIYRIAVNKSLEYIRKRSRLKRGGAVEVRSDHFDVAADTFYHPGVMLENRERSAILFQHIDKLPESQKVAFLLQKLEGLSVKEIAQVLQKSESSVESLLKRSREKLREKLSAYYEGR